MKSYDLLLKLLATLPVYFSLNNHNQSYVLFIKCYYGYVYITAQWVLFWGYLDS